MKKYLSVFVLVLSLSLQVVFAQEKDSVKLVSSSTLKPKETQSRISALLKTRKEVKLLTDYLAEQGYKASTGPEDFFGQENIHETVANKKRLRTHLYVQNFSKGNSKESASIGITGCDDKTTKPYYFVVFTSADGKIENAKEFFVQDGKVVPANSWVSCLRRKIGATTVGACAASAIACSGHSLPI